MNFKKLLGNVILYIHIILFFLCVFVIFASLNIFFNYLVYCYIIIACTCWLIFNTCPLTPLENYLMKKQEKTSIMSEILSKFFYIKIKNIDTFIVYMNFVLIIILSLKLYYLHVNKN